MELISLEDLASRGREQAVRHRFDQLNLRSARVLAVVLSIFALSFDPPFQFWVPFVAGLQILGCWIFFFALGRVNKGLGRKQGRLRWLHPLAELIRSRKRVAVMSLLLAAYALMVIRAFGGVSVGLISGSAAALVILPAFLQLTTAERLVLHGAITGTAFLFELSRPALGQGEVGWDNVIVGGIMSAVFFVIGQFRSVRLRRRTLKQWAQAREQHGEKIRMRQELEYAREIQLSMLPEKSPDLAWLEVASLSLPAAEVGGDYYDFFVIDEDRMVVVIGDVAGHGFSSGLLLSGVRSCLTLLVDEIDQPRQVMAKLQRMVRSTMRHRMLVTLAIVLVDRARGRAVVTSAGHPPLLTRSASDGEVREAEVSSLPLGSALADNFAEREVKIGEGDLLLLYTDGFYETESPSGEVYGLDRLERILAKQAPDASADEVRESLLKDLWEFKGEEQQADDITMVVLRVGA